MSYCSPAGTLPDLGVYQDIHAVSSALKLYLRELPVPLVAYDVYNLCLIAVRKWCHDVCMPYAIAQLC